jgi:hypothetical protein
MPNAIREFFDATNHGDSERFVAAFGPDAYLNDWGREFRGRDGAASWNRTDNIGKQARFEVQGVRTVRGDDVDGEWIVTVTVTGNGYNGPGEFTFELADGLISRFVIA